MASTKEIRTKIVSVQNTQKITKAMEMVSASKMRKSQDQMIASKPYSEIAKDIVGHLALASTDVSHSFLQERDVKRIGYLVISTDRGLCGGLNINLFKQILINVDEWRQKGIETDFAIIGSKGGSFFSSSHCNIITQVTNIGDTPSLADVIGPVKTLLSLYRKGQLDKIYIASNQFVNTMSQTPSIRQLLPILPYDKYEELKNKSWDYLYEPDNQSLIDVLLRRYVESQVYQAVVDNLACEQAARMVAMKAATDNGGELIKDLQIIYNKVRQGAITNELIDIVSGASAVSS